MKYIQDENFSYTFIYNSDSLSTADKLLEMETKDLSLTFGCSHIFQWRHLSISL